MYTGPEVVLDTLQQQVRATFERRKKYSKEGTEKKRPLVVPKSTNNFKEARLLISQALYETVRTASGDGGMERYQIVVQCAERCMPQLTKSGPHPQSNVSIS